MNGEHVDRRRASAVVRSTRDHYATVLPFDSLRLAFLPHRAKDKDFGRELATSVEDESQRRSAVPCLAIWAEIRLSKRTSKKSERD